MPDTPPTRRAHDEAGRSPHTLILSTADWDAPLWTNKQHLASRLHAAGHVVTYVDSLGLRRPAITASDLRRLLRRVVPRPPTSSARRPGPSLISPVLVPIHRSAGSIRRFNARRLRGSVARWLDTEPAQRVLWTFSPVTYGLEAEAAGAVYHCVDLLGELPGIDARVIEAGERALAERVDVAIASSHPIAQHLGELGFRDVRLWENVADTSRVESASIGQTRAPAAVFAGNLTPDKVDIELLEALVERVADLTLHVAGPRGIDGSDGGAFDRLLGHERVHWHGVLDVDELGRLMGSSTVGLIPYLMNRYTRGVFPLKVYEYLAAGLAVVSTPLPSLAGDRPHVRLAEGADDYVEAVRRALPIPATGVVEERRRVAAEHSWEGRTQEAARLIRDLSEGRK